MYTREILPPERRPVEGGEPVQGTWNVPFREVNLLGVRRPYPFPLPRAVLDFRIREWETFIIQDDKFLLFALLADIKLFRWAQVLLYDKESGDRLRYRKMIPGPGWRLPRSLANGAVESRSWGFYFRIHDWLDADIIRLDLNIAASPRRPAFTANLEYGVDSERITPLAVSLVFSGRRSMTAFKAVSPVRGDMVFGGRHIAFAPERTTGFFGDFKGFYPYLMLSTWCTGHGFDEEGRRVGFSLAENQAGETFRNNENALWVDGKLTPLPPVKITRAGEGGKAAWVIQDLEGMVDLTFTPKEAVRSGFNFLLTGTDYETPLGWYNGALVSAEGEKIRAHNLWGMAERLYLCA